MDFSTICRTCMKSYENIELNPIFLSEDTHERFSSAFYSCTGVQINFNDGLPQNMCTACMNQFNNTLKFRKQCTLAETELLRIKTELDSENSTIVTNKQHCLKIKEQHPLTTDKSDIQNSSNVTRLKSELKIIKNEPLEVDMEGNRLSKYLLHENILKINHNDIEFCTENTSDNEYFSEETVLNKHEGNFNNENVSSEDTDRYNNETNIPDTSDSNFTENNKIDIPYIITETVTKKTVRVVCKLCQKELSIRSIDSHMMRRHPGADERKVKCELCDKYVMREKLNRHRVMMHGSVGVKCGYCKSEFKSKELLVDHVTTCTAKNRKRKVNDSGRTLAECDVCKMTMQRASLNKHKAVKHAGLRPVCEHCGKSFGNKFRLNEHYRAKHGYEKFQCSYCDFKSAGIMAMRNHERRHRGEKPFVCEECGAKFHAAYLLMQHKHSHKTEKLVKCDLCPASFKANNNLHMHKLTCHSKSYYSCTLCSRSYKCRYYAAKHARLAHSLSGAPDVIKLMAQ